MDYLIRDIDREVLKRARIRAIKNDVSIQAVIKKVIQLWANGKLDSDLKPLVKEGGERTRKGD